MTTNAFEIPNALIVEKVNFTSTGTGHIGNIMTEDTSAEHLPVSIRANLRNRTLSAVFNDHSERRICALKEKDYEHIINVYVDAHRKGKADNLTMTFYNVTEMAATRQSLGGNINVDNIAEYTAALVKIAKPVPFKITE